jgi:hypothetical protein
MVSSIFRRIVGADSVIPAARQSVSRNDGNVTRRQCLELVGYGGLAILALKHLGCGEETPAASCSVTPIGLNQQNVDAAGFNGGAGNLLIDAGQEVLHFTAGSATDPGVAIMPKNSNDWITDCSQLRFELKGSIVLSGSGTPRIDVQIYLEGDNPSTPSIPGSMIPLSGDWSSQSVQIPAEFAGRRVVKIQPLAIGGVSSVDITFRNLRFE